MTFRSVLGGGGGLGGGDTVGRGLVRLGADVSRLRGDVRKGFNDVADESAKGAQRVQQQSSKFWTGALGIVKAASIATAGAAVGAMGIAASASINYESAFAGVIKTVDAAPAVLDRLRGRFREMAKEIPISASEFARLGEAAGALGVKVENIEEFARVTALIGVTTDVASEQAATSLGQLSNVLDLTAEDYERFGSTLVDLGNKGASTESQILEIASRSGAMGKQVGLSTPAILAFASAVANLGIEVEAGGSALQYLYSSLSAILADEQKLGILAETVGMTGEQFRIAFQEDAQGAIISFLRALGELDSTGQAVLLDELGLAGVRTSRAYIGLAESVDKNLLPSIDNANAAWEENNALQIEAEKRFATTESQIALLKNRVGDLFIELGDRLLPAINTFVTFLAEGIPNAAGKVAELWNSTLGPAVEKMFDGFSELGEAILNLFNFGDEATEAGDLLEGAFDGVGTVLSVAAEWAGKIATAIADILESDIGGWITRTMVVLGAARILVDGLVRGTRFLSGLGRSTLRFATFGMFGGPSAAERAAAEATGGDQGLQIAARELRAAASALLGAAGALRGTAAVDAATPGNMPIGGGTTTVGGGAAGANARAAAAGAAAASGGLRAWVGGVVSAGRGFLGQVRAGAGAVFGAASKLFWPALVGGLVLDIAKEPVAGFVRDVLGKEKLGQEIARDGIIAGIGTWWEATVNGLDVEQIALMQPEFVTAAGLKITRVEAAKLGLSDATIETLSTPEAELSLEGMLVNVSATHVNLEGMMAGLNIDVPDLILPPPTPDAMGSVWTPERADQILASEEARAAWSAQIRDLADRLNIDLAGLYEAAMAEAGTQDIWNEETLQIIERVLRDAARATREEDRKKLRDAVTTELKRQFPDASDAAIDLLTGADIEFLAAALTRNVDGSFTPAIEELLRRTAEHLTNQTFEVETPEAANPELRFTDSEILPVGGGGAMVPGGLGDRITGIKRSLEEALNWEEILADPAQRGERAIVAHANDMLDLYNARIAAAAKSKSGEGRDALMEELGVGTWDEVLNEQKKWLDQNGSTRALDLATSYSTILTAAAKSGVDLSREPWAEDIRSLLEGMLDDDSLPPDIAAKISDLLDDAFADARDQSTPAAERLGVRLGKKSADGVRNSHPEFVAAYKKASEPPEPDYAKLDSFAGAIVNGVATPIRTDPKIRDAISAASKPPALNAETFREMGRRIIQWIADGAAWSPDLIRNTIAGQLSNLPVPQSPVKWGPLKHPFLPNAGRKIMQQINEGILREPLAFPELPVPRIPALDVSLPQSAAGRAMAQSNMEGAAAANGPNQSVHIDRAYFRNEKDEQSLLARTRFLMPRTN